MEDPSNLALERGTLKGNNRKLNEQASRILHTQNDHPETECTGGTVVDTIEIKENFISQDSHCDVSTKAHAWNLRCHSTLEFLISKVGQ